MKEIRIKNIGQFSDLVSGKNYRKWIYRGQSESAWQLESSLHRAFENAEYIHSISGGGKKFNRLKHEAVMIDRFKCNAHLYLDHLPKDDDTISWVSLMQHHGAPTRLLDFTFSPYVALFFALESGQGDAAVYCLNCNELKNTDALYFGDNYKNASDTLASFQSIDDLYLMAFEPRFSNKRLLAQQGLFVAPSTLESTHEEIISEYGLKDEDLVKIIIPKRLRYSGLRLLSSINVNASNVYPGLDGFCQSMKTQPVFGVAWQTRLGNV